MLRTIIDYVFK